MSDLATQPVGPLTARPSCWSRLSAWRRSSFGVALAFSSALSSEVVASRTSVVDGCFPAEFCAAMYSRMQSLRPFQYDIVLPPWSVTAFVLLGSFRSKYNRGLLLLNCFLVMTVHTADSEGQRYGDSELSSARSDICSIWPI